MIEVSHLQELLSYDPDTGFLVWRPRARSWFTHDRAWGSWNAKYAGKLALNTTNSKGYLVGAVLGHSVYAHRVVWAYCHGVWPTHQIDHVNRDKTDNRLANLREATNTENQQNMGPRRDACASGVVGVYWHGKSGRWSPRVGVNGRSIYLGLFDNFNEAVAARKAAERRYGFHENHGREATPKFPAQAENTVIPTVN